MLSDATKKTLKKTARSAMIAGGGAGLTFFLQAVSSMDFGQYGVLVAGLISVLINAVHVYVKANT